MLAPSNCPRSAGSFPDLSAEIAFIAHNFALEGFSAPNEARAAAAQLLAATGLPGSAQIRQKILSRLAAGFCAPETNAAAQANAKAEAGAETATEPETEIESESETEASSGAKPARGKPTPGAGADPCMGPGGVLANRFGFARQPELDRAEALLGIAGLAALSSEIAEGDALAWDLKSLFRVHRALFSPLYAWGGKRRAVDTQKNGIAFAHHRRIDAAARRLFAQQEAVDWAALSLPEAGDRFADFQGELYAIHVFREGNSRSARAYLRERARSMGFCLDFERISAQEWRIGTGLHFNGDPAPLRLVFAKMISRCDSGPRVFSGAGRLPPAVSAACGADPFEGILPPAKKKR